MLTVRRGALPLIVALLVLGPARAQDEDVPPDEAAPSPEALFEALGAGRERGALADLRKLPPASTLALARRLLAASPDPEVLLGAAEWVGEGTPPPRPGQPVDPSEDPAAPLRARLAAASDPVPRATLLEALGAVGGASDVATLEALVRDADADASAAARGLCRSRSPQAMSAIVYTLRELAERLQLAREEEALFPPEEVTPDAGEEAPALPSASLEARRRALTDALRWMATTERGARLIEAARLDPSVELLEALEQLRRREHRRAARDLAVDLTTHADPALRAGAVGLLAACRALQDDDPSLIVLALSDEAPEVRRAAAAAAWPLQLDEALPRLIELLEDEQPEVRGAAHETLKKFAGLPLPARRSTWEAWLTKRAEAPPAEGS